MGSLGYPANAISEIISAYGEAGEEAILNASKAIVRKRFLRQNQNLVRSPSVVKEYVQSLLEGYLEEHFGVIYLDTECKVIDSEILFKGTLNSTSVFPRVVVRKMVLVGADSIICFHQHPGGNPEPSQADITVTQRLKDALAYIDASVHDHLVVGDNKVVSFLERGLL